MGPIWFEGAPENLEAAAEDADKWLELIERLHAAGRWQFGDPESLQKLSACRTILRRYLTAALDDPLSVLVRPE